MVMYKSAYVTAVLLAAGIGKRMCAGKNKVMLELGGKSVLAHTAERFFESPYIDEVVAAASTTELGEVEKILESVCGKKKFRVIEGGADRQESSYRAVSACADGIVLIHDGVRPFVNDEIINSVIENAEIYGAAAPGIRVTDTIKRVKDGMIEGTVSREELFRIQTPQGFIKSEILRAHLAAKEEGVSVTDDCMLMECMGVPVKITQGSADNIKLTVKEDMAFAEDILRRMR